jgi:hypothetical protein
VVSVAKLTGEGNSIQIIGISGMSDNHADAPHHRRYPAFVHALDKCMGATTRIAGCVRACGWVVVWWAR